MAQTTPGNGVHEVAKDKGQGLWTGGPELWPGTPAPSYHRQQYECQLLGKRCVNKEIIAVS